MKELKERREKGNEMWSRYTNSSCSSFLYFSRIALISSSSSNEEVGRGARELLFPLIPDPMDTP